MKDKIRKFIIETFMQREKELDDNKSLFESGIIDSMGFIMLFAFIEKKIGVSIAMSERTIENFDSVNKIAETIKKSL